MPAARNPLPAGICAGHVAAVLPAGYSVNCRLGQLVDVRCPAGHRYLLSQTASHWHLHRRLTPDAPGHARNALEYGPPLAFPKPPADDDV